MPLGLLLFGCYFVSLYSGQFKKLNLKEIQKHEYVAELARQKRRVVLEDDEEDKELQI